METEECPIWGTPATVTQGSRDGKEVDSPRAGGRYFVSETAKVTLQDQDDGTKARLTSWLVEQRGFGLQSPEIATSTIDDAKLRRRLPVHERADRLLRYLGQIETHAGGIIHLGPSITREESLRSLKVLAPIESTESFWGSPASISELRLFLDYLEKKGWVSVHDLFEIQLTVDGYARLEELGRRVSGSSTGFVAMWFDGTMESARQRGIMPAIRDAGYEPVVIDQKEHINKIDDEIVAEIRRSCFVVADFTHGSGGPRGGVYYEAGFAQGLGIPVISCCREDLLKDVHFDVRQYNEIVWKEPKELRSEFKQRIEAVIGEGPHKPDDT